MSRRPYGSRAEVEPRFERLNGVDVAALILAENVERRNLSVGQRAMARAMLPRFGCGLNPTWPQISKTAFQALSCFPDKYLFFFGFCW
jgi:hypothetical protein